ncbi:MAG: winged helix-turn-helix transcriptional regulator [Candidatus Methanoperedens sp.]
MKIENDRLLELETRKKIYAVINNMPGIYLRELERETSFTIGQLTYHLPILVKANLIKEETTGRFKRFYPLGLNVYERKILPLLRRPNLRKIIILVLENKRITNKELSDKMSVSPATISWYIQILKDANLIHNETRDNGIFYSLMDEDEIIKVLIAYKESFLDKMIDRFIETWDS